jgi:hypothetical protein
MWIQYKHRFAYGEDKEWKYIEIPDDWQSYGYSKEDYDKEKTHSDRYIREGYNEDEALADYLATEERLHDQYDYSDKYRGFKFEKVDGLPPNDELQKRLNRAKSNAEYWSNEVDRFQAMVDQTGEVTKDDFNV